jgi:hypothetical protein
MPGPHCKPGFAIVELVGDPVADNAAMEAASQDGPNYAPSGFYTANGKTFAVFVIWYPEGQ